MLKGASCLRQDPTKRTHSNIPQLMLCRPLSQAVPATRKRSCRQRPTADLGSNQERTSDSIAFSTSGQTNSFGHEPTCQTSTQSTGPMSPCAVNERMGLLFLSTRQINISNKIEYYIRKRACRCPAC